ncbi:hypothetical protein LUZ60_014581 [Juncus effusus]|nr:hypothetical protein LUZ60_014581 [Juncus effusus]
MEFRVSKHLSSRLALTLSNHQPKTFLSSHSSFSSKNLHRSPFHAPLAINVSYHSRVPVFHLVLLSLYRKIQTYVRTYSAVCRNFSSERQGKRVSWDSDQLGQVVSLIKEGAVSLEAELAQMDLGLSQSIVMSILCVLNQEGIPASRFSNWVLNSHTGFVPSPKIYNQMVNNFGRVNDFDSMFRLLTVLSRKGHCLTEKSFDFLTMINSGEIKSYIERILAVLNAVAGSCRGSGIFSLIRSLCSMNEFDLAIFVIEETAKSTHYYNALIAAKCKNGDSKGAHIMFDEMRDSNCDPNMNSFNYIISCLLKYNRVNETCDLLELMEKFGYSPNELTYELLAFHACKTNKMDLATQFLDRMLLEGLRPRIAMHGAFIKGYFLHGREKDAYKYVLDMSERDKFSVNMNYSILISLFHKSERVLEAGRFLYEMLEKGLRPNFRVYMRVIKELNKMGKRDLVLKLKSMFMKCSTQINIK